MQPEHSGMKFGSRLRAIGALLGEVVLTRFALVAAEVEWLIATALRAFLAGLAAVALTAVAALLAITATLIAVPESLRALTAALSALALSVAALGLFVWSSRLARFSAFSVSLAELRSDLDRLHPTDTRHEPPTSRPASDRTSAPGHERT